MHHLWDRVLARQHLALEIDLQSSLPHLEGQVGHRGVAGQEVRVGERRVVVQHVQATKVRRGRPPRWPRPGPRRTGRPETPRHGPSAPVIPSETRSAADRSMSTTRTEASLCGPPRGGPADTPTAPVTIATLSFETCHADLPSVVLSVRSDLRAAPGSPRHREPTGGHPRRSRARGRDRCRSLWCR